MKYYKHRLYHTLHNMKSRCYNKNHHHYKYYGLKNITICDEWLKNTKSFIQWGIANGYKKGLQIDRIDNNGNYEPSNCRFVSNRENCLNSRLLQSNNKSGYVGISKSRGYWRSRIKINNKEIHIKFSSCLKEVLDARNKYIIDNDLEEEYKIQKYRGE